MHAPLTAATLDVLLIEMREPAPAILPHRLDEGQARRLAAPSLQTHSPLIFRPPRQIRNEIDGEHVHPGYAFPLWHGALALVARLAGVDPTLVVLYLPAILVPLALLVTYGAGRTLFGSEGGGVATTIGWLALFAFPFGGVGSLQYLAQPGGTSRFLLVPAVLGLVFAFVAARALTGEMGMVGKGIAGVLFGGGAIGFAYVWNR